MLIKIPVNSHSVEGFLEIPKDSKGIVLFAHGSGSSRHSKRNNFVAEVLWKPGLATLLTDLLTEEEDLTYENRFNIDLLTGRFVEITRWIQTYSPTKNLSIGFFGASTGAAVAIEASVILSEKIKAVVSRGGRPDLAKESLGKTNSPTLFIVGGSDYPVTKINQGAFEKIKCTKDLKIVEGATHLFEEPGTLEQVAKLASEWFVKYL